MRKIALFIALLAFISADVYAAKTTYVATNHRFNYVKLKEVSGSVAEGRMMTHPVDLDINGFLA